jgi:hypothetical protein
VLLYHVHSFTTKSNKTHTFALSMIPLGPVSVGGILVIFSFCSSSKGFARSSLRLNAVQEHSIGMPSSDDDPDDGRFGSSWYDVDMDYLHAGCVKYGYRLMDYVDAWWYLRSVRVFSQFDERSHRFDATPAATGTATAGPPTATTAGTTKTMSTAGGPPAATPGSPSNAAFLLAALGMKIVVPRSNATSAVEPPMRLVDVVHAVYENEEAFSQKLFGEMVECFREAGWDVRTILRAPQL